MQVLSHAPIQAPISLLEKTPPILEMLLRDVPSEVLQWKPAAERWSIAEVLAHMVVIEQLYGERARRIVMEDVPVLTKYVAPSAEEVSRKPAGEYLEKFAAMRRAHIFFFHTVPAAAAPRTGRHPEMGLVTVSEMLHELANHDLGHLRQIAEIYRACAFYPHAGPFQRYSQPKP